MGIFKGSKLKSHSLPNAGRAATSTSDYEVAKTKRILEGSIEKVPVYDNDIVNKSYADSDNHTQYLLNTGDTATGNYTFDTNTLFIDSTNNRVGIGTDAPVYLLDVNGLTIHRNYVYFTTTSSYINGATARFNNMIFSGANPSLMYSSVPMSIYTYASTANYMKFSTNDIEAIRILGTNQYVGIGTTSPTEKLHIVGNVVLSGAVCIQLTAGENISGGYLVRASRTNDLQVVKAGITDGTDGRDQAIGVAMATTISGAIVNVAVSGLVQVYVENTCTRGDFLNTSASISGAVTASTNPAVPADANHWREIGHALQSGISGSMCYANIHFN